MDRSGADCGARRVTESDLAAGLAGGRRYLLEFDFYRVVAFLCVIAQHAVLWPVPRRSEVGWSLVMLLHATREVFFFLSALLAAYSQLAEPRPLVRLWVRRIGMVLVPFLAWTLIYFCYSLASSQTHTAGSALVGDLEYGYYQLYFLVVLFQVFVVLPAVIWLVRRARGHHGVLFATSFGLQLAMMTLSHYFGHSAATGALHAVRAVDLVLIDPHYLICYQLYVVAGVVAADHLEDLQRIVERHSATILWVVFTVGMAAEGYYAYGLVAGQVPGHASDLFQPVAVVWFLAACAGLWAGGSRWARHASGRRPALRDRFVTWGSDASGGFYLAHVLVLQLVYSGLVSAGLSAPSHWWAASLVLFVTTLVGTGVLVAFLLRSRLRWVLTGPERSRERAALVRHPALRAEPPDAIAPTTASAMAR